MISTGAEHMDGVATGGLDGRLRTGRSADPDIVKVLRREARLEMAALLHSVSDIADTAGGFHGDTDADGRPIPDAPRGAVLYARLLWLFSALAGHLSSAEAAALAQRAAVWLRGHFIDPDHGGLYWRLDASGQVTDARKHAYVQASGVHAFAEHARVTDDAESLRMARDLQRELDERFWDRQRGGYVAAMTAFWHLPADQRLLDSDPDSPKTAAVHLRIVEAYAHLHRVAPTDISHAALHRALGLFIDRFVDLARGHLCLFYNHDWDGGQGASFGHDIAASWRLWDAASVLGDRDMQGRIRSLSLSLAAAVRDEGRHPDGRLRGDDWAQAEGVAGFVTAWQVSGNQAYLDAAGQAWPHARAGFKRAPYFAARALIELDRRLKT
jgi:mannobiose 2-epimerase